jgi:hypothetical protein
MEGDSRNNASATGYCKPPVEHRFKPGNPGRPVGARHKLGEAFLEAMYADFKDHGVMAIVKVRDEKPDQYLKVVASILPKELEAGERLGNILEDILARVDGRTRTVEPLRLVG